MSGFNSIELSCRECYNCCGISVLIQISFIYNPGFLCENVAPSSMQISGFLQGV